MNYDSDVLKKQIITYLGNKRKLIPFIDQVIDQIIKEDAELQNKQISFFDIFSGSGIVSRYAKLKGFQVFANDLEIYSYIINKAFLETNLDETDDIFNEVINNYSSLGIKIKGDDTYLAVLDYLNSLKEPKIKHFAIYYAPQDTNNPDFEKERLFYTQENALKIDAILENIHNSELFSEKARNLILATLLYNMTIHINTSGTMKGFHNGWGGKGKAALNRILGDIVLEKIPLLNGIKGKSFNDFAEKVFIDSNIDKVDIIYADPPYNQHQYSANYNHLTTATLNDFYNPGEVKKGSRAGIRTDHNRSDFCKSVKQDNMKIAEKAFIDFIDSVKAKYIIMSYNNEGVVSIDRLIDILYKDGANTINIEYKLHDKFKGGKANQTSNKVIEYLIIIKTDTYQSRNDFDIIKKDLLNKSQKMLFTDMYIDYNKIDDLQKDGDVMVLLQDDKIALKIDIKSFKVVFENIDFLSSETIDNLKRFKLDSLELFDLYIENKSKYLAQKLLSSFKIKKYDDIREKLIKDIDNI
jgi:adenine-specific DNA-methyltransferase